MTDRIPVSLVLGSGGARGLAHIGVIRALRDDGRFEVRSITGTSIGALIGGLHAGDKLELYTDWVLGLSRADIWNLLDFSFTLTGLFEGERLMAKLADLVGEARIEDLPIPFTAVASDIERRQEVWLSEGSLFEAIRASIAIPGLFTPVERDGRLLVDGGLLSPLPLAPAQRQTVRRTIAVSLNGPEADPATASHARPALQGASSEEDRGDEPGALGRWLSRAQESLGLGNGNGAAGRKDVDALDIIAKSVEAMQDRIARFQLAAYRTDLLIEIPVDACGILDFHLAKEMIELGYRKATEVLEHDRAGRPGAPFSQARL
ncbi:patatin-like phospholipase family protein [Burkholderiaceae bacterium FT117]|uniref:patatin-like phospholipase family protein n=1 Tax=Zeimonas sediminis TaxID=2944268 RepID=UPI0023431EE6|nr:patatin-like phospholipase family protein [Zeimonas sediminis]MCM5569146.1 patatin-like phospholipase family protein [Zeimonas sediminis]